MINVLMVCHGNICRSPMAEFILADMITKRGLSGQLSVDSAATSREEIGNSIYPPARNKLREMGVPMYPHAARQVTKGDYKQFDYILCMEKWNLKNLSRIISSDPAKKIHLLMDFTSRPRDIADPWYTGNFDMTYDDVVEGCECFLKHLEERGRIQ